MNTKNKDGLEFKYKQLQDFSNEINWRTLVKLIVHYYVESGIGLLQIPVESMIRIYFIQLRYNLNAAEVVVALSKIDVLTNFALIDKKTDIVPEQESIESFQSLIELNDLTTAFSAEFNIEPSLIN